jgi:hypothetical protein
MSTIVARHRLTDEPLWRVEECLLQKWVVLVAGLVKSTGAMDGRVSQGCLCWERSGLKTNDDDDGPFAECRKGR